MSRLSAQIKHMIEARLDSELLDRINGLKAQLGGKSTDDFGFDPETIKMIVPVLEFFYRQYFRVESYGLSNLPKGRVLFISNHSGQVPIDAMMIGTALLLDGDPPRAVRPSAR